jgi:hypothetical protein
MLKFMTLIAVLAVLVGATALFGRQEVKLTAAPPPPVIGQLGQAPLPVSDSLGASVSQVGRRF